MIKEKFALLKKHVNECDNKLELNQIFLYLTSFNSEDINTLIHNIGGVTGLETLKVNKYFEYHFYLKLDNLYY